MIVEKDVVLIKERNPTLIDDNIKITSDWDDDEWHNEQSL